MQIPTVLKNYIPSTKNLINLLAPEYWYTLKELIVVISSSKDTKAGSTIPDVEFVVGNANNWIGKVCVLGKVNFVITLFSLIYKLPHCVNTKFFSNQ